MLFSGRTAGNALIIGACAVALAGCATTMEGPVDTTTSGTNREFSHEVTTSAPPDRVWALWTDVSIWKTWDKGLKDAELAGPMALGARGKIVPVSGPSASFAVTEFEPKTSYAFVTNLPLAKLTVRRTITGTNPTRFRHDVSFSGALAPVWASRFGPGFRAALPPTMNAIAASAEAGLDGAS